MTLRCRKGDLAVLLAGCYSGYFVTVKKFVGAGFVKRTSNGKIDYNDDLWEIDAPSIPFPPGVKRFVYSDKEMLPIRPSDLKEADETEKEVESV